MQIRSALQQDAATIARYNVALARETESLELDSDTVYRGVLRALTEDRGATYWLAEIDGEVVGQLMTTREWSDWQDAWYVWLQSVYVHADFRGRGVFRSLLTHVLRNAADARDVHSVRLYVEEENDTAQQTYRRLGFTASGYHVLHRKIEKTAQNS